MYKEAVDLTKKKKSFKTKNKVKRINYFIVTINYFQSELSEQEMYSFEQMNFNRDNRITKHYYCINNDKLDEVCLISQTNQ